MRHRLLVLALMAALAAGCSSRDTELKRFIEQTKQEQPGGVDPLPPIKPTDNFVYDAAGMRSPFVPGSSAEAAAATVRRNTHRNPEFLEQFPLDSLNFKGVYSMGGRTYGLVLTKDNQLIKVSPGNYVGQNDGRIDKIEPSKISITELVPDGTGGLMERTAALALKD